MVQTARHHVDLLAGPAVADWAAIDTALTEFDTTAALEVDSLAHVHGTGLGDHGGPVARAAALVVTLGLVVQTGILQVLQGASFIASLGPVVPKSGSYTMLPSDIGSLITVSATGVISLPLANTVANGAKASVKAHAAGVSIGVQGSDTIWSSAAGQTSMTLTTGDEQDLRSDGVSVWEAC